MKSSKLLLGVAGALLVLGVVSFLLQPGPPDHECAAPGEPTSGWVAADDPDCAITIESYEQIRQYNTSPKLFRIAGLGLVVAGLAVGTVGIVGAVRGARRGDDTPTAGTDSATGQ